MNQSSPYLSSTRLACRACLSAIALCAATATADARTLSPLLTSRSGGNHTSTHLISEESRLAGEDEPKYVPLIIKLTDAGGRLPEDVVELRRRGALVLAYVPLRRLDEVAALGEVSRIEGGQICTPVLDLARGFTGYPDVESGVALPSIYTGKGVVVGFADIGFDPNHIAFSDPATGASRVRLLTDYGMTPDECVRLETPGEIATWSTDDPDQWHATHVAGIMAGGYKGNPYWGIATDADIVASTSDLYDALLLAGMEDVVEYAREVDKPAVINMSVSASLGPHDGTSLFCQYLEELSKEATICISAGNWGSTVGCWDGVFPEDCATGAAVLDIPSWSREYAKGYLDIWSGDNGTFDISVIILDFDTQKVVVREEFPKITTDMPEVSFAIGSSAEQLAGIGAGEDNGRVSEEFAGCLDGVVTLTTEINPENGRFNGLVRFDVSNYPDQTGKLSWRYVAGIEVKGKKGQHLTAFTSDMLRYIEVPEYPKFARLTVDGNINDFITGHGVIGVGAMCSRDRWPLLGGGEGHGNLDVGSVAQFSSCYSKAPNGALPDVTAPGAWLVSAISTPYMETHPDLTPNVCHMNTIDGKEYYWDYSSGTSMSSPYVAGVCALWKQAVPDLTTADIKQAMLSTLTPPTIDPYNVRWGKGILNSYEGLKSVLMGAGVDRVGAYPLPAGQLPPLPSPLTAISLGRYAIDNNCRVFTPDGREIAPSMLSAGMYILKGESSAIKVTL